jgi:hypothetical protein
VNGHPERSAAESKDPVDCHFEAPQYPAGSLDSARDDKKEGRAITP